MLRADVLCVATLLIGACSGASADHDVQAHATVGLPPANGPADVAGQTAPPLGSGGANSAPASPTLGSAGQDQSTVNAGSGGSGGSDASPARRRQPRSLHRRRARGPARRAAHRQPDEWTASHGEIDLVVPEAGARVDGRARLGSRATTPGTTSAAARAAAAGSAASPARMTNSLCMQPELVPEHQECTDAEDGYAVPGHASPHDARAASKPSRSTPICSRAFRTSRSTRRTCPSSGAVAGARAGRRSIVRRREDARGHREQSRQFPTEGDLGKFIQCGGMANGASSIHGALHFKWVVNASPYSLGKQPVNIDNYMFWKLHGWIDKIWERYRVAKGLTADEPKLVQALIDQCREMHTLGHAVSRHDRRHLDDPLPGRARLLPREGASDPGEALQQLSRRGQPGGRHVARRAHQLGRHREGPGRRADDARRSVQARGRGRCQTRAGCT